MAASLSRWTSDRLRQMQWSYHLSIQELPVVERWRTCLSRRRRRPLKILGAHVRSLPSHRLSWMGLGAARRMPDLPGWQKPELPRLVLLRKHCRPRLLVQVLFASQFPRICTIHKYSQGLALFISLISSIRDTSSISFATTLRTVHNIWGVSVEVEIGGGVDFFAATVPSLRVYRLVLTYEGMTRLGAGLVDSFAI